MYLKSPAAFCAYMTADDGHENPSTRKYNDKWNKSTTKDKLQSLAYSPQQHVASDRKMTDTAPPKLIIRKW